MRWLSTAVVAVSIAAAPRAWSADAPALPAPQQLVQRDLQQLQNTLTDKASTQAQRDEAARRLLSRQSPEARAMLAAVLVQNPTGPDANTIWQEKVSVARALSHDPAPEARFIDPLARLMRDRTAGDLPEQARTAAAQALGHDAELDNFTEARRQLLDVAQDAAQATSLREQAITALGDVVDRNVATALVALLNDPRSAIQNAADTALVEMTGRTDLSHHPEQWQQWRKASAAESQETWWATVLRSRANHLDAVAKARASFAQELSQILADQYRRLTTGPQRDQQEAFRLLMRYLDGTDPQTRVMGIHLIATAFSLNQPYPREAPNRLVELVGDSDREVRLAVAATLRQLNIPGAVDAIVTQAAQEPDPQVEMEWIGTLGQLKDLRAADLLLSLLQNHSQEIAIAAANALRTLWPANIGPSNQALAQRAAATLWRVAQESARRSDRVALRAACIEAMGPLRDAGRANDYVQLLNDPEPAIREAAVSDLGDLRDPGWIWRISQLLGNEPDSQVRREAVDALGQIGNFEMAADTLYRETDPNNLNPAAAQHAWQVFDSLLTSAKNEQVLKQWSDRLRNQPEHQISVQRALDDRLRQQADQATDPFVRSQKLEDLALEQQNTGAIYLNLKQWEKAAAEFRKALDYFEKNKAQQQVTLNLVRQLMDALLKSRDYKQAVSLAHDEIARVPAMQSLLGPMLRNEAESLKREGEERNDRQLMGNALQLINLALDMKDPSLDPSYQSDLQQWKDEIDRRLNNSPRTAAS